MTPTPVDPMIINFYADSYDEDARLRLRPAGRIEFLRTQELLRRHLPTAPAEVLDIGGGTGIHAEWLATDGHTVRLLDPVPAHVAKAAAIEGVEDRVDSDLRAARMVERDPAMLAASPHLLAVGWVSR